MRYEHTFRVDASRDAVAAFHRDASSMTAITPPPVVVRVHEAPPQLGEGDEMAFTLWLGPLPVRWRARIEQVGPDGFTDRQLEGPFARWVHEHRFVARDDGTTEVRDSIEWSLRWHPLWLPVGLGMALTLPLLFAYRGWRTRGLVGRS